jgi:hypothetical protein
MNARGKRAFIVQQIEKGKAPNRERKGAFFVSGPDSESVELHQG